MLSDPMRIRVLLGRVQTRPPSDSLLPDFLIQFVQLCEI